MASISSRRSCASSALRRAFATWASTSNAGSAVQTQRLQRKRNKGPENTQWRGTPGRGETERDAIGKRPTTTNALVDNPCVSPMDLDAFVLDGGSDFPDSPSLLSVIVHDAISGQSHTVGALGSGASGNQLRDALSELTDVPVDKQILLVGPPYTKLKLDRPLVETVRGKDVYLYDARALDDTYQAPSLENEVQLEYPSASRVPGLSLENSFLIVRHFVRLPCVLRRLVPSEPEYSPTLQASGIGLTPMQRAAMDFEAQITFQVVQGGHWKDAATARGKSIGKLSERMETQCKCAEVATKNLLEHFGVCESNLTDFSTGFAVSKAAHDATLAAFEASLDKLKAVKLHSALATESRATLQDCVPVDKLKEWHARCVGAQSSLASRIDYGTATLTALRMDVNREVSAPFEGDACQDTVKSVVLAASELLEDVKGRTAALEASGDKCKQLCQETLSDPGSALRNCQILNDLYDANRSKHLAMLATSDAKLRALQEQLLEARQTVTSAVITRLRAVSVLQSRIRELNARVVDHKQALTAQANAVAELAHVEAMPAAYKACLQEVVRRRTFEKLYVAEVEAAADKLSRLRASETYAREAFLRRHGRHLPKNLVRGLNDRPPHVDILTRPFDTALPAIDPASIEPSDSPVSSDIEEQSAVSNGPDDISRENILRLQHENAKLKAQLASFAAFCVAGDSAVKLRRASTPMVGNSDHTTAEEMASPRTLRDLSLQICEKVAMLSQEAQDDEKALVSTTRAAMKTLADNADRASAEVAVLRRQCASLQQLKDRIAYRSFDIGDVAMFFPVPLPSSASGGEPRRAYIAFNEHAPHRFLSDACTAEFRSTSRFPTYVIGRIVNIESAVATAASNPYSLPVETTYYVLTVSAVEWGS